MNVSRFMIVFHAFFIALGVVSLFLMTLKVLSFDATAFWTIVLAIFLNVIFEVLWLNEALETRVARQKIQPAIARDLPMVSFVVPVFNQEASIMQCVNALFECALSYHGSSEIFIVDDGSVDSTFEVAWTTINSRQRDFSHIRARVVKHMVNLGRNEAVKTVVNKAIGEYIALIDSSAFCDRLQPTQILAYASNIEKAVIDYQAYRSRETVSFRVASGTVSVYSAYSLRRLLYEREPDKAIENMRLARTWSIVPFDQKLLS